MKRVLMLAAENGVLAGAKVGGMADVIRDLPAALVKNGVYCDVIMPGYGFLPQRVNAKSVADVQVPFSHEIFTAQVYRMMHPELAGCFIYFIEHSLQNNPDGSIYTQGHAYRPFAKDSTRFAFFCLSVAVALKQSILDVPDCIHLHDWHMGMFALLRAFDPHFLLLQSLPCVFSIHNLALQGIRPFEQDSDGFASWYPELAADLTLAQKSRVVDVNYQDCINPMRAAINLSDRVHLVSTTYAKEVLKPSNHPLGFFGGEGLEADLRAKMKAGKLVGILNGCYYDEPPLVLPERQQAELDLTLDLLSPCFSQEKKTKRGWQAQCETGVTFARLLFLAEWAVLNWLTHSDSVRPQDTLALQRLSQYGRKLQLGWCPDFLMTSVGRLTDQKVLLLRQPCNDKASGVSTLEALLQTYAQKRPQGLFILIGSGDEHIAKAFLTLAAHYPQFIFLNGYDEALADSLFRFGDLFLMPSSFEPCGISQMLAMREGQLCLVHGVGGLKDTVSNKTGFVFKGANLEAQVMQLQKVFAQALDSIGTRQWQNKQQRAKAQRFLWSKIALAYKHELYLFE